MKSLHEVAQIIRYLSNLNISSKRSGTILVTPPGPPRWAWIVETNDTEYICHALSWKQHPTVRDLWLRTREYYVVAYTEGQLLAVLESNPNSNCWCNQTYTPYTYING